ncbi:MAG: hypothetical protein FWD26_02335 [Treponema sp.]|nr:hypothetical protein [Treponema sp.]
MKKFIVVLVLMFAATALFASPIQLGSFPVGQWLDPNYSAIWDFSSNNIRILSTDGRVLYDFSTKTIQNFRVFVEGVQPGITFSCPEAGRTYRFIASLPNTNVVLEIERSGQPKYSVTMRKQ